MKKYVYVLKTNEVKPAKAYSSYESAKRAAKGMLSRREKKFSHIKDMKKLESTGLDREDIYSASLYTYKTWTNKPEETYTWFSVTISKVELFA